MYKLIKVKIGYIGVFGMLCSVCIMALLCMGSIASADEATTLPTVTVPPDQPLGIVVSGNYEYAILNEYRKEAAVTKVLNYGEKVEIPSNIDGYNIIRIGTRYDGWFPVDAAAVFSAEDSTVKELVIPEGVVTIEDSAFRSMKSLKKLSLPDTLEYIRDNNFMDAAGIKKLVLPAGIGIGDYSFKNCAIDTLVAKGSVNAVSGSRDDYPLGMFGTVKSFIVHNKDKSKSVKADLNSADVKNAEIDADIKEIHMIGKFGSITLKNPKTKLEYEKNFTTYKNIKADIAKVKVKKASGRYVYSWQPVDVAWYNWDYEKDMVAKDLKSKVKYTVLKKNKSGKYKKLKTTKKTSIELKSNEKIRVVAVLEGRKSDMSSYMKK